MLTDSEDQLVLIESWIDTTAELACLLIELCYNFILYVYTYIVYVYTYIYMCVCAWTYIYIYIYSKMSQKISGLEGNTSPPSNLANDFFYLPFFTFSFVSFVYLYCSVVMIPFFPRFFLFLFIAAAFYLFYNPVILFFKSVLVTLDVTPVR